MRRPTSTRRHSQGETTLTLPHDRELYFVTGVDGMPYLEHQNGEASKRRKLPCPVSSWSQTALATCNRTTSPPVRGRPHITNVPGAARRPHQLKFWADGVDGPSPLYNELLIPLGESLRLGRTAIWATVAPCRLDASTEPL